MDEPCAGLEKMLEDAVGSPVLVGIISAPERLAWYGRRMGPEGFLGLSSSERGLWREIEVSCLVLVPIGAVVRGATSGLPCSGGVGQMGSAGGMR